MPKIRKVVDNVDNSTEVIKLKEITLSEHQGINESNLMTLPFVSMKRKPEKVIERKWARGGQEVGIKVLGSAEYGCPTMYDLDVLLALFRIMMKNVDNKYLLTENNSVTLPNEKIHFTFRQLAREMGLKSFGQITKDRLVKSIRVLTESTIYSKFSIRDCVEGKFVLHNGVESCRIITKSSSYSVKEMKFNGKKLASPKEILDKQYVIIDEFFYKNMCSNYFKVYDRDKYLKLKSNIAKKLFLILTQWSKGYEKYVTMQVLYDYIGLEIETKQDKFYYNRELKKALKQLQEVGFIDEFEFLVNDGVKFLFSRKGLARKYGHSKYTKSEEVVARLREFGVDYNYITTYCTAETIDYVAALLRYTDDKISLGQVNDTFRFIMKGLPFGRYNVDKYLLPK